MNRVRPDVDHAEAHPTDRDTLHGCLSVGLPIRGLPGRGPLARGPLARGPLARGPLARGLPTHRARISLRLTTDSRLHRPGTQSHDVAADRPLCADRSSFTTFASTPVDCRWRDAWTFPADMPTHRLADLPGRDGTPVTATAPVSHGRRSGLSAVPAAHRQRTGTRFVR